MRGRRGIIFGGLLIAVALVATACPKQKPATPAGPKVAKGGQITFASEQEQTGFNVNTSKDNLLALQHVMRMVWPSAYRVRPDYSLEPYALSGPAKVTSEAPFTVEWTIKENAKWNDGVPVSSDDFEFYWDTCNGTKTAPEDAAEPDPTKYADCASTAGYDKIEKFEKLSTKKFRTIFKEPYVEFEGLFSAGSTVPPSHIAKKRGRTPIEGWNTGFDSDAGAAAGPYQIKEWVKGDHLTLERNPTFWGKPANLDTIVFRYIPDGSAHPAALQNNEVQLIYPQPQVDLVKQVEAIPNVFAEAGFGPTWEHLDFNQANELLAIKEVRQAFAYGVDRDAIVAALVKPFSPSAKRLDNRVFVVGQKEYEAHGAEYAKRDIKKAQAALERAGFAKGADGVYAKDGKRASFRLRINAPNPRRQSEAELIQAQMKEVGVEIKVDPFARPLTIGSVGQSGDFDMIIFAWVGTPFFVSNTIQSFASASDSNWNKYSNSKLDEILKKASTEPNRALRVKAGQDADKVTWEDLPNLPLFQLATYIAYQDKYVNIKDNTTSEGPFWNVEEWGIKQTTK